MPVRPSPAAAPPQSKPLKAGRRPLGSTFTHRLHSLQKLTDKVSQSVYADVTALSLGEARCLTAVGAFAPLSVKHLARAANVDKGQASRAAQALVDKGLVLKAADLTDARGVVLSFTPAGEALCRQLMTLVHQRNEQIVGCLTSAERAEFDRLLTKLVSHAEAVLRDRA